LKARGTIIEQLKKWHYLSKRFLFKKQENTDKASFSFTNLGELTIGEKLVYLVLINIF
jgi:hypothetical protein